MPAWPTNRPDRPSAAQFRDRLKALDLPRPHG